MTLVSIFLYYQTCPKCSISQHELYSQEKFWAGIAWSIAGKASEREMEQKQFYCLSKLIDLEYEKKKGNFVYFPLFNSILKSRFRGQFEFP